MSVRIFVHGPASAEMEGVIRNALGPRPPEETWLISLVRYAFVWGIAVLVSPLERLRDWSYVGPQSSIGSALTQALVEAGFERLERRVRNIPHSPERRRFACAT
jgi:hypothetical protein